MKQLMIMFAGVSSIFALINLGCSTSNQLAAGIIYDAKAQIRSAKEADAHSLAPQELADAEQMFSRAEDALVTGKESESYRLGMRAYLKAKLAEIIATTNQIEAESRVSEQELALKVQTLESARRALERAERELEQLRSTPVENSDLSGKNSD